MLSQLRGCDSQARGSTAPDWLTLLPKVWQLRCASSEGSSMQSWPESAKVPTHAAGVCTDMSLQAAMAPLKFCVPMMAKMNMKMKDTRQTSPTLGMDSSSVFTTSLRPGILLTMRSGRSARSARKARSARTLLLSTASETTETMTMAKSSCDHESARKAFSSK